MSEMRKIGPSRNVPGGGQGPYGISKPVEKAKDFRGTLRRLVAYLRPHQFQIFINLLMAAFSTVFSIASPKIMGMATTRLFEGIMLRLHGDPTSAIDFSYIFQILWILGALYFLSNVFSYIQHYLMAGVAQKIVFEMRQHINDKLSRLPLKFYDAHTHGEILSRVINDVDNIATTLQQSLTQVITSVVTFIGILIMMLAISPLLTLIAVVTLPLSFWITAKIARRSQNHFASQQKNLGELNGHIEEMYTGHQIIKAYGREAKSISDFKKINGTLYESGWRALFISGLIMPLMVLIGNIGYVLICIFGGIFVMKGMVVIGDMQAFLQYMRQFTHPIVQISNIANVLQSMVASAERVFDLLDETEELPDKVDSELIRLPRGHVAFQEVSFGYEPDSPLIENVNIDIRQGQIAAIIGPTGAGKTTLVNLLMRFYEIADGRITVDGVDIRDMKRENLRSIFGMVLQDTWLFNGTIKDNIAYGRKGATDEEIHRAARMAHADHFIRTLPEGYDTILNEEASNISQGQKQLLTIARAILADPVILILDEATSNVDSRTEILIQKAMVELMQGRTSFVIAHRLSTIREADVILVMNNGQIVEQGTHPELLYKGGLYAEQYRSQFADVR